MITNDLSYLHLTILTFQAILQVVIICVFGFVAAKKDILTPTVQRHVSTLNVLLFTPCLIFSKLASSLSLKVLADVAIIPIFFVISTGVCYFCAQVVSRALRLPVREKNFVTAMAVFGNSNSLPVSLTVSLAYTLPLTWPDIKGDNADDVASRGLLYLLLFQQLGQILRWSWGYNSLLAKPTTENNSFQPRDEEDQHTGSSNHQGVAASGDERLPLNTRTQPSYDATHNEDNAYNKHSSHNVTSQSLPGSSTPSAGSAESLVMLARRMTSRTSPEQGSSVALPSWTHKIKTVYRKIMAFMNVPLWSMLAAIIVASIPALKNEMFENDGFIQHTVSAAIEQLGKVAIPMILVVLGANLAPNSESKPTEHYPRIVLGSLLARMVMPSMIMLPIVALSVKYIQISILDDPIFLLVAFILTIAPPAIQLSQICQLNGVFEHEMAGVLFWGYVVLTLPSTILIVLASLQVLDWSGVTAPH